MSALFPPTNPSLLMGPIGEKMKCENCGITYDKFRTGFTYHEVYHMVYNRKWKRRNGVLGKWHEIKKQMWQEHVETCDQKCNEILYFEPMEY